MFFYFESDSHGFSLLHWAAFRGRLDVVELLLYRGVRINSQTITGDTPLHFAVTNGHIEIVIKVPFVYMLEFACWNY